MKLTDCKTGREFVLRCRIQGNVPPELKTAGEHRVVRSAHDGSLSIEHSAGRLAVEPIGRESLLTASDLADPNAVVLLQLEPERDDRWLVCARVFAHRLRLESPLELTMPPEVEEKLGHRARGQLATWVGDQLACEQWCFAWCGGRAFDPEGFELLGRTRRLRVARREGRLVVVSVSRALSRAGGILVEGRVKLTTERDLVVDQEAGELVEKALSGSDFMDLWTQYQQAERKVLEEEASRLGRVTYKSWKQTKDGLCFTLPGVAPPPWRGAELQLSIQATSPDGQVRVQVGQLARGGAQGREIHLALEELETEPPAKGTLSVDLQGDATRWKRRERALATLRSNGSTLPDLGSVLEGAGRTATVGKPLQALSGTVLQALSFPLTPAQARAVEIALNTPDIALIQGPPGTGKTLVIRVIAQRLHEAGRRPVLLCAFQHDAVLRVLEGTKVGGLPVPRIGGRKGESSLDRTRTVREWLDDVEGMVVAALADPSLQSPWTAQRERIAARIRDWRRMPGELPQAEAMLRELQHMAGAQLPPEELEQLEIALQQLRPNPPQAAHTDLDWSPIEEELRRQRLNDAAWSDDGPAKVKRLERAVKRMLPSICDPALKAEMSLYHKALERAATQHRRAGVPAGFAELIDTLTEHSNATPEEAEPLDHIALVERAANRLLSWFDGRRRVTGEGTADALARFLEGVRKDPMVVQDVLRSYADALGSTVLQAVGRTMSDLHGEFDTVIVDEAARANPLDLLVVLVLARRIILVGDQAQLPHVLEPRLERAVTDGRAKRAQTLLRESLFARTWDLYREGPPGNIQRVQLLDKQFRMHPIIGRFISDTFYNGGLQNGTDAAALTLETKITEGKPIAWFDIRGAREARGSCYRRKHEASALADRVDLLIRDEPEERSIGVISFYAEQVRLLQEIHQERAWGGRVLVGTVDAFQGREFDCVLLSCVRSGHGVGFLALPNRLNVAMSRAQRLLAVFGDTRTVLQVPQLKAFHERCLQEGFHA